MATCSEVLIRLLENYGIDTVFGIPGVHTIELYRGLGDSKIRHVTPRHEQGAGFMADGYARASGKPAACFIISGPGMTNIATAMAQALQDSIPMLVISAVNKRDQLSLGEGRLHEMRAQKSFVEGVSRYSHTLLDPANLPKVLARAFGIFSSTRPGPVHIEIPLDVFVMPGDDIDMAVWPLPSPPAPDPEAIKSAGKMLALAKRPLIIAGGGAVAAHQAIQSLAEKLSAPVITTVNAKGILPIDHPLSVGGSGSLQPLREEIDQADVLVAIGTEFSETDFDFMLVGDLKPHGDIIRMDIDPAQLSRNVKPTLAVHCDAHLGVSALNAEILEHTIKGGDGAERTTALRAQIAKEKDPSYDALFAAISNAMPEAIIAGDSCQPTYYAWLFHETKKPRRYFHSASGFGTLGYALPAAIGASIAKPDNPVISLIGDGGAQFTIGELASAMEVGANVVFLIWNNTGYSEISRFMDDAGTQRIGVDVTPPDFVALAQSYGCPATRAETLEQLTIALESAGTGPVLIDASEVGIAGGRPNI